MLNAEKILELANVHDDYSIMEAAKAEIRDATARKKGGTTLKRRVQSAAKYLKEAGNKNSKEWSGCTWVENGKQAFVNGYSAFLLNEPLEGLKAIDGIPFPVSKCFPGHMDNYVIADVNITDIAAYLKIFRAEHGRKTRCDYDILKSRYNAQYILDCYKILGGNIVFKVPQNGELTPAVLESENGKALLCPIMIQGDEIKRRAAC